jgi:hypothetical protein
MKRDYEDITAEEVDRVISSYIIGRNAARNRAIMRTILIDGTTYERTAEMYDLSPRQVANIVRKYEYLIFKHIKRD